MKVIIEAAQPLTYFETKKGKKNLRRKRIQCDASASESRQFDNLLL